jgi:outer membrane protein assembly factor BamB
MIGGLGGTWLLRDESMGPFWLLVYAIPLFTSTFVVVAVASHRLAPRSRRAALAVVIVLTCAAWLPIRMEGIDGDFVPTFAWRWTTTSEERVLSQTSAPTIAPASPAQTDAPQFSTRPEATPIEGVPIVPGESARGASPPSVEAPARGMVEWSGFRGPRRDGIVHGVRIVTDWSASPPVQLWRRAVGPGWSSFAVHGDLLYTQEQRGEDEIVSAYRMTTGEPAWIHRDAARFFESNGGAGPRGTPTAHERRVYTFGATGILNALDARSGAVIWSRNAASDADTEVPYWGFSSSPVVVDDLVIVGVSGQLVAYDRATGKPRWFGPAGPGAYSSPHLTTIDGVPQILLLDGAHAISVTPAEGKRLWAHAWPGSPTQPAAIGNGHLLIASATGTRRIAVVHGPEGWTTEERWTSIGLKPTFNDFAAHEGHAFGFDGGILACIDLKDGARKWKGGRYGHGQMVLLAEQDVLLVLSEEGDLALVRATPDQFTEVSRFKVFDGKTWNHPALVGDILLVRNGEEMAAFRLALEDAAKE